MQRILASQWLWVAFGAIYGVAVRLAFQYIPHFFGVEVISISFMFATPMAIGAIVVYGLRERKPSIAKMIVAPWLAILLALIGSAVTLLEGSICIVLASPVVFLASSIGGLAMGLMLRWTGKGTATLNSCLALPLFLMLIEPSMPVASEVLESRAAIEVSASPQRVWREILVARDIRAEELPISFTNLIGVPRPLEGVNLQTPEGEVRFSKWDRGVNFRAKVVRKEENRSITWNYEFSRDSFPAGSMDDHVAIGGKYFDLYDTTFDLVPIAENRTRLEITSHYRVSTGVNFYGVPVARFIAQDFMTSILALYKLRSEKA